MMKMQYMYVIYPIISSDRPAKNRELATGTMAPAAVREMNSRGKNLDASGPLPFFAVGVR